MTKSKLSILTIAVALGMATSAQAVITLDASGSFGGSQYRVYSEDGISWLESEAEATGLGSGWRLVSITSAAENDFVVGLLDSLAGNVVRDHYFIGLTDTASEGTYVWTSGEAFGYTNWHGGEPNNIGDEDYVAYDLRSSLWKWNDLPNDSHPTLQRGFIAERVPDTASTLMLFGLSLVGIVSLRRNMLG